MPARLTPVGRGLWFMVVVSGFWFLVLGDGFCPKFGKCHDDLKTLHYPNT
jgi:hypothetical protein